MKVFFKALSLIALFGALTVSCKKEGPKTPVTEEGTVKGMVVAEDQSPIADATITIEGTNLKAVSGVDGKFQIAKVPISKQSVKVSKAGFADVTLSLSTTTFKEKVADLGSITMQINGASIVGKTIDAQGKPLKGVEITLNGATKTNSAEDGTYKFEKLTLNDYTLVFKAEGCVDITEKITKNQFTAATNYLVTVKDIVMGAAQILPGATAEDLLNADVWHYNEYRGGKNGDDYPHFDWSSDYMGTFTSFYGWLQEQNEGTTLQIRNSAEEGHQNNPADLENFDSYLAGIKMITADNSKMSVLVRAHGANAESPVHFGVMVVDPNEAEPKAVRIGDIQKHTGDHYQNYVFDLSAYEGKAILIAIGIYRAETGDYWKQLCLRRIGFAKEAPANLYDYMPGELVAGLNPGYKMTMEMVRSTMPVTEINEFSGISSVGRADIDGPEMYRDAYKVWRAEKHFAAWWSCMPVKKDTEPFAGEGYVMKTNGGGTPVSLDDPQCYFYAKFEIKEGHNQLTLNARTFSSTNATFFKMTAITEDGTVTHLMPANNHGAATYSFTEEGAVRFMHEQGDANAPEDYAHFNYDLSEFNGKNVIIALATFKGEDNGDENKLSIHSITIK